MAFGGNFFRYTADTTININRVADSIDRASRKVLFRAGGYVRTTARRSIRKRKTMYAKPGNPPFSKLGWLRRSISFKVEPEARSVIIGPTLLNTPGNAASLHEFGGTVYRRKGRVLIPTREVRLGPYRPGEGPRSIPNTKKFKSVLVTAKREYKPRPYMGPALQEGAKKFPKLFYGSLK